MEAVAKSRLEQRFGLRFGTLQYTVNIDDVRRIAYFETPKVACTTIKKYLMDQYVGGSFPLKTIGQVHDRSISPLKALAALDDIAAEQVFGLQYRRICFVRNPFTRVLSGYLDKIVTNEWERARFLPMFGYSRTERPEFKDFLLRLKQVEDRDRDIHFMSQTRLTGGIGNLSFAFRGRFECFVEDFRAMKRRLFGDLSDSDYSAFGKHHASGANDRVAGFFGPQECELVSDIYAVDFDRFSYSRNIADAARPPR